MSIGKDKNLILMGTTTTLELAGVDLGPTDDAGVSISADQTFYDCMIDQSFAPVRKVLMGRKMNVNFNLKHANLANLLRAFNLASGQLSGSSLTVDDSFPDDASLKIVGVAPHAKARTYIFDQVIVVSNAQHTIKRSGDVVLPLNCEVTYSTTNDRFCIIGDAA